MWRESFTRRKLKFTFIPSTMQNYHQMSENDIQKRQEDLEQRLGRVRTSSRKEITLNKQNWYKIGKRIIQQFPIKMHPESKTGARRTYQYYHYAKGDWEGPTTRAFGKMNKAKFEQLCIERVLNKGPWQDPLLEGNLLDPVIVGPLPQEGLVGTSHSRPKGDDVLEDTADSRPPIADGRQPIAERRPPIADRR